MNSVFAGECYSSAVIVSRIGKLRNRIVTARGRERVALAVIAGALSVLALAPFFVWPVLFLTMPVFVWLIDGSASEGEGPGRAAWRAGVAGWLFGFGYFLAGLFWIGEAFLVEAEKYAALIPFAVTLLPAGLAFFFAAAALSG